MAQADQIFTMEYNPSFRLDFGECIIRSELNHLDPDIIYSSDEVQVQEQLSTHGNNEQQREATFLGARGPSAQGGSSSVESGPNEGISGWNEDPEGWRRRVVHSSDDNCVRAFVESVSREGQVSSTYDSRGVLVDQELTTNPTGLYRFNEEFVFLKRIGKGEFGVVMACRDRNTGKKIATKKMLREKLRHLEVTLLAEVRHPCVIAFLGVTIQNKLVYLHMEHFEDARQLEYFGQEGFRHLTSQFQIFLICYQLLDALNYLAGKQIIHRDLAGRNILIRLSAMNVKVKIVDFGLAVRAPYEQNTYDVPTGDPLFFAPEILEGERYLTTAADTWSVAINIIFLLRGSPECEECVYAYKGNEYHPLMCNHLHHCHHELRSILEQMLTANWQRRPAPYELLKQLHEIQVSCHEQLQECPVRLPVSNMDHPIPPGRPNNGWNLV